MRDVTFTKFPVRQESIPTMSSLKWKVSYPSDPHLIRSGGIPSASVWRLPSPTAAVMRGAPENHPEKMAKFPEITGSFGLNTEDDDSVILWNPNRRMSRFQWLMKEVEDDPVYRTVRCRSAFPNIEVSCLHSQQRCSVNIKIN